MSGTQARSSVRPHVICLLAFGVLSIFPAAPEGSSRRSPNRSPRPISIRSVGSRQSTIHGMWNLLLAHQPGVRENFFRRLTF